MTANINQVQCLEAKIVLSTINIVNYCQRKHFEIAFIYIVYVPVDNAMYTKIVTRATFILVQIFEWQLKISV